jgi:hypothetical protein
MEHLRDKSLARDRHQTQDRADPNQAPDRDPVDVHARRDPQHASDRTGRSAHLRGRPPLRRRLRLHAFV